MTLSAQLLAASSQPLFGATVDPLRWFTQAQIDRAAAFHGKLLWLSVAMFVAKAGLLCALLVQRERIRRLLGVAVSQRWYLDVLAWSALAGVGLSMLNLIAGALAHRWFMAAGLSHLGYGAWLIDAAKARAFGLTTLLLSLLGVYACIGWLGRRRWWIAAFALLMLIRCVPPLLMAGRTSNLQYDLAPLAPGPLRSRVGSLIAKSGHRVDAIMVANTSRFSTRVNAWIAMFGPQRRLVFTDTLLARYSAAEIGVIVAHELGHLSQRPFLRRLALAALKLSVALAIAHGLFALAVRHGVPFGTPATVPLYLVATMVAALLVGPITNAVIRRSEIAANAYALELTQDPASFISVQRRVAVENLSDIHPPALIRVLYLSHPSPVEAIASAERFASKR